MQLKAALKIKINFIINTILTYIIHLFILKLQTKCTISIATNVLNTNNQKHICHIMSLYYYHVYYIRTLTSINEITSYLKF